MTPNGFRDFREHGHLQAFSLSCASMCASGRNFARREYERLVKLPPFAAFVPLLRALEHELREHRYWPSGWRLVSKALASRKR